MKIYTGNFANLKKYIENGLYPISIALSCRYFSGRLYRKLSPEWEYKDDPKEQYEIKFNKKLKSLSKEEVIRDLSSLSQGKDVILLCHERYGEFCHRHIVNDWIGGDGEFLFNKKITIKETQQNLF